MDLSGSSDIFFMEAFLGASALLTILLAVPFYFECQKEGPSLQALLL